MAVGTAQKPGNNANRARNTPEAKTKPTGTASAAHTHVDNNVNVRDTPALQLAGQKFIHATEHPHHLNVSESADNRAGERRNDYRRVQPLEETQNNDRDVIRTAGYTDG